MLWSAKMLEGPAPPFVEPTGPFLDDMAVLRAFVQGVPAGYSTRFHVERTSLLLVERTIAAALRIGDAAVLVRADLPDDLPHCKRLVEAALTRERLSCFDKDTLLGLPVGLQLVGLRLSSWDLRGANIDNAFSALRGAAVAEVRSVLR